MKAPILITGAARSGTSLVAAVINLCGAFGGKMSGKNVNNQKGMFENSHIRDNVVKPYLRSIKVDPLGQYPLPDIQNLPIPTGWKSQIEQTMIREGYIDGPWMYKGAKMTLMWPVWDYAFPDAKWVVIRRKSPDIVTSCLKTGFMRAFHNENIQRAVNAQTEEEGWLWWIRQHEQRWVEMINAGVNIKVVWPERMVQGDYSQMYELVEWLGLEWSDKVMQFVDPKLWKSRHKK